MDATAAELVTALVDAFPAYVRGRVSRAGLGVPPGFEAAVAEGRHRLAEALEDLLERPFAGQDRGPLELFQEALRFPTAALAEAGHPVVRRDEAAVNALPGDLYDLAPASSLDLGEEAWRAHMAWGVAKARAMAGSVPG